MRKRVRKILATGAAGFIGSEFVRQAVKQGHEVIVIDKLTYAGDLERLGDVKGNYVFYKEDICNKAPIESILRREKPEVIINFAAETHVDRSIQDSAPFIRTNIQGTQNLLDLSRKHKIKQFIHISTDEVYGEIKKGRFNEDSPLKPNSPYAASKAAADLLVRAYIRTHGFPAIIVRPCNNYGPWQYPEKFIPLAILKMITNEKIPIYGKGKNVREWLYVGDCAQALLDILEKGKPGQIYNLGSQSEKQNIDVAKMILKVLKKGPDNVEFIKDRPGHDIRYSLDSGRLSNMLKWRPKLNFEDGLETTINWYLCNKEWLLNKHKGIRVFYKE